MDHCTAYWEVPYVDDVFKMATTSGSVEDQVNRLLAAVVPEIFDGDEERDPEVELLLPLKRILTNGEVELSEEEDSPSTRCGKTLDVQEVAYCCRYRNLAHVEVFPFVCGQFLYLQANVDPCSNAFGHPRSCVVGTARPIPRA